jgi:hypothetical protein
MKKPKYICKKQTDDGYYWKVVNAKTREVVEAHLSKFDAQVTRDELNNKT